MRLPSTHSQPSAMAKRPRSSSPTSMISSSAVIAAVLRARPGRGTSRSSARPIAIGLEARRRACPSPCRARACRTGAAGHRLDAERAGLHRILEEVGLEEPLAGSTSFSARSVPSPLVPPVGPNAGDAVEHQQHRAGQARRAVAVARGPRARSIDDVRTARVEARALLGRGGEADLVRERRLAGRSRRRCSSVDAASSPTKHSTSKASMIMPARLRDARELRPACAACRLPGRSRRAACRCRRGCGRAGPSSVVSALPT